MARPLKVPPASPAPSSIWPFAGLSRGQYQATFTDRSRKYRPLVDRVEKLLFSRCSMPLLTTAVDAVDTLRVLSRWFVLLGEGRVCVYPSARTIIHAPAQRRGRL
jgi:hypothetical protein